VSDGCCIKLGAEHYKQEAIRSASIRDKKKIMLKVIVMTDEGSQIW